ncbi:MAG: hypothetical protein IIY07_03730 [Thermoguttaceae bacterium]|nr:hypothetical protein [Thermoguttaceae bacterium]
MAKLSGFFMSTLLILLCLWINVCHYPDAPRAGTPNGANEAPVDSVPSDAPVSEPLEEKANEQDSTRQGGLLADSEVAATLLDVSADPASTPPVLEPASFPDDGAEIAVPPRPQVDAAPQPSVSNEKTSSAAPQLAPGPVAPSPTPQTASPAVATPTQDVRRSATKPRGAKYVRVPEVEIDAFSGGVRVSRSANEETRVVGATRAGQTQRVAPPAL